MVASWEMNVCLLLRKICRHGLPMAGFFLDVLTKGFMQRGVQILDERTLNTEHVGAIMCWKKRDACSGKFPSTSACTWKFFFFLSLCFGAT